MATPRPYHSEILANTQAQARLKQLSAQYKKRTATQIAYWSRTQQAWIIIEVESPGYSRLTFYKQKACPC